LLTVGLTMLIVYAVLYGITAYLDRVYSGSVRVERSGISEAALSVPPA
jgi:hypothetical protein